MCWEVVIHNLKSKKTGFKVPDVHRFPTKSEAEKFRKQFISKPGYQTEICKVTKLKGC
ncbi:TPA: hypothetical protein ACIN9K_001308 [Streptococcus agalactiae]|nr:hypothetical protein [Streptococcus agalactiae]HEN9347530.1 hypothetical protein [Streptococcus agalactiae]HEO2002328.1 hypothetical protein [Streptococcus agalactiae]HEO3105196.1 hypothetical protein [Streptococcus agalactiae]HEO3835138.1 hypothetical protein [Streptococcus agalactiae]